MKLSPKGEQRGFVAKVREELDSDIDRSKYSTFDDSNQLESMS